jgi:hypothetical protein
MFYESFIDELEKIAAKRRGFGQRTTSRYPKRDIEGLKSKVRPKDYEHRDNSLAISEFAESVPSAFGRMGRQDRGR